MVIIADGGDANAGERQPAGHLCLYNTKMFSALNIGAGQQYHRLDYECDGRLIATLAGVREKDSFTSGFSAALGGIDMVRDPERIETFPPMVAEFVAALEAQGVRDITLKCKSGSFSRNEPLLHWALIHAGFTPADWELNAVIDLERFASIEAWTQGLKSSARRALRHGLDLGLNFREADGDADWRTGYAVIAENRAVKGRRLSLGEDYVMRLRDACSPRIRMFLLEHDGSAVAATLYYQVTTAVGSVMWWGDARHDLPASPMNVMARHIVDFALGQRLSLVELGNSTRNGVANVGTLSFKQSLGCRIEPRLWLRRRL